MQHPLDEIRCHPCGFAAHVVAAAQQDEDARGELTGAELPGSRAAGKTIREVVIDLDATLVTAHWPSTGPGRSPWPEHSPACGRSRSRPDSQATPRPSSHDDHGDPDLAPALRTSKLIGQALGILAARGELAKDAAGPGTGFWHYNDPSNWYMRSPARFGTPRVTWTDLLAGRLDGEVRDELKAMSERALRDAAPE